MLSAKQKLNGQPAFAFSASQSNAPFFCPECRREVVLKRGSVRLHHFAHKSASLCHHGVGETDAHRRCKIAIYQGLLGKPRVRSVELECSLRTCRPDVSFYLNGVPVAIEVQISALTMEKIIRRTAEYARKGIYVLWLPQWRPELDTPRYSPRLWERWIHAAYFGRIYYWLKGLSVVCYHFDPHFKRVRKTSFSSRNPDGGKMDYARRSKRYRVAVRGETLNLARDFFPKIRAGWKGGKFTVPFAKLYMHR